MADNYQKLSVQQNLNANAINRAQKEIQRTGRALPCRVTAVVGSIVTVSFEVQGGPWTLPPITIPKAESQWVRSSTQIGDFGVTVPADTYLGGVSGMGGGVADVTVDYGNLTTLVWVPIASTAFPDAPSLDQPWINGPEGAYISDTNRTAYLEVSPSSIFATASGTASVQLADNIIYATAGATSSFELSDEGATIQVEGAGSPSISVTPSTILASIGAILVTATDTTLTLAAGPSSIVITETTIAFNITGFNYTMNGLGFVLGGNLVSAGDLEITANGKTFTFGSAGFTTSSGIVDETHIHGGVTTGSGTTGEPEAG